MHSHLSILHSIYLSESQPFRKVHRMMDLFESIIKSHTAVIIAEYEIYTGSRRMTSELNY